MGKEDKATQNLKAIETIYDGYRFRSRLEARWAVFFNALGIPYEYEKEGFDLGDAGRYLPDFWLPNQDCWVEIKGQEPSEDECMKAGYLSAQSGKTVYIFYDQISIPHENSILISGSFDGNNNLEWDYDEHHMWCECPKCGFLGIQFKGYADRLSCGCLTRQGRTPNTESPKLIAAYTAARQAQFEKFNKKPVINSKTKQQKNDISREEALELFLMGLSNSGLIDYAKELIRELCFPLDEFEWRLNNADRKELFKLITELQEKIDWLKGRRG